MNHHLNMLMWWIQLFPQFRNLSFHLFHFIDKQRKHRCIINRLVLFRVLCANHQIREDFLNFVCDEPVFMFMKEFGVLQNRAQCVEAGEAHGRT